MNIRQGKSYQSIDFKVGQRVISEMILVDRKGKQIPVKTIFTVFEVFSDEYFVTLLNENSLVDCGTGCIRHFTKLDEALT